MTSLIWRRTAAAAAAMIALGGALAGCGSGSHASSSAAGSGKRLVGVFKLTPGAAKGSKVTGTWFRMVQVGGTPGKGPYMVNADSKAAGGTVTLLRPGTSGGLRTGGYQTQPKQAFAADGASRAADVIVPVKFFGVKFSISTNQVDPQTKATVAPPTVVDNDGKLTADLSSWAASWNNQNFNQGAPKPVPNTSAKAPGQKDAKKTWDWVSGKWLGAAPAPTLTGKAATGTYDPKTGHFTLEWTSLIVGGPFNRFTGEWHLEGVFKPTAAAPHGA